jgi:hypothetical protein
MALILLASAILLVALIGYNTARDATACGVKAARVGTDFTFGYWSGCRLLIGGTWVDADRIVVTNDGRVLLAMKPNTVSA